MSALEENWAESSVKNALRAVASKSSHAVCFQACGDRDNPSVSVSDKAYCIPANPMSDRGQAVCFQQNQREEVRLLGEKTGAIAANGGAHQTNYIVFKERAGCPGGGKGILCGDKRFTLSTLTDQAVCYAVRTAQTNANGIGVAQDAHTLDGANAQAVCYQNKVGSLCMDDYKGINQQYVGQDKVVVYAMERPLDCMHDQQIALYTKQAIGHYCELKVASTQQARQYKSADDLVVSSAKPPRKYIIRRLTPLECARLQGFPDCWCSGIEIENPTEEEIAFWSVVWETHRTAMEKSGKPKSRNQIIKWLRDPRSDSSEYKMWGNGIALPNAAYVVGCAVKLMEGYTA